MDKLVVTLGRGRVPGMNRRGLVKAAVAAGIVLGMADGSAPGRTTFCKRLSYTDMRYAIW